MVEGSSDAGWEIIRVLCLFKVRCLICLSMLLVKISWFDLCSLFAIPTPMFSLFYFRLFLGF